MSDEKQETIANIVREMRNWLPHDPLKYPYPEEADNKDLCSFADRIEAVWKREKAEIEADALNVGALVATTEKSSAVGNAAAMRDNVNLCLAKFIPHKNSPFSCNNCAGIKDNEHKCYHRVPWNIEEEDILLKQDRIAASLEVLYRVHDFIGEIIRDNLIDDTPRASDLADDVWNVLHWDEEKGAEE